MKRFITVAIFILALGLVSFETVYAAEFQTITSTATKDSATVKIKAATPSKIRWANINLFDSTSDPILQTYSPGNQPVLNTDGTLQETFSQLKSNTRYEIRVSFEHTEKIGTQIEILGTITTKTSGNTPIPSPQQNQTPSATVIKLEKFDLESTHISVGAHTTFTGDKTKTYQAVYEIANNAAFTDSNKKTNNAIFNSADGKFYSGVTFTKADIDIQPSKTYYVKAFISHISASTTFATEALTIDTKAANVATNQPGTIAPFKSRGYKPLAFIPGFTNLLPEDAQGNHRFPSAADCAENPGMQYCNFGDFLNFIIELAIALGAVMLVVKLVIHGYSYMTQDVPRLKMEAKTKITESLIGILLALTAYLILNTINPALVNNSITLEKAVLQYEVVNFPEAGDETVDPEFKTKTATYSTDASLSPGAATAVKKLKNGWEISAFRIYTNKRMLLLLKKGTETDNTNIIDIDVGLNGFSEPGSEKSGDKKTPKGTWKIIDVRKPKAPGQPVFNRNGSNMGAAFFHLSPTTNGERGIGMHGNKRGTLSRTNGCIRMKNTDIIALLPYVKTGTPVYIGNN